MSAKDYTITLTVDAPVSEVFQHINNVPAWWTENLKGSSVKLNDEFEVRFGEVHYSKHKLVEGTPDQKVVWLTTDSKLTFVEDEHEWTGTKVSFELSVADNKTNVHFTHFGLIPTVLCYKGCTQGWDYYIKGSLFKLITEGKGTPELK